MSTTYADFLASRRFTAVAARNLTDAHHAASEPDLLDVLADAQ